MKIKIIFLSFVLSLAGYSQEIDFYSPQNIKLFADFLFCEKDYLRSIEEYKKYLTISDDDTIEFKIALAYSKMSDIKLSLKSLDKIKRTSYFYNAGISEKLKLLFIQNNDSTFYAFADKIVNNDTNYLKLFNSYYLLKESMLIEKEKILNPFNNEEKIIIDKFYERKTNPPYKKELLAGILSAIVPGSGKIYTEEYSDGITAFILTGLFTYLAYSNFDHKHYTRAWIFSALGAGFYAGNIYGSVASAQIFNAKINFNFENDLKIYLEEKNYFTPVYDFCD